MTSRRTGPLLHHLRRLAGPAGEPDLTDTDLLGRYLASRDEAAFAALVHRHGPAVLGVCRCVLGATPDAEDAFQAAFLVLARHAGSIRKRQSLGSWLHGVALRVARKQQSRDRHRPAPAGDLGRVPARPLDDLPWREVRQILHEELDRLPERFRTPLVLCHLEGRTQDEAAVQLGWSAGTLRGRLLRGRELLRARLARRGLAPAVPLLAATLIPPEATTMPAALAESALRAASGAVPPRVAALAAAALGLSRLKWAGVLLLVLAVAATGVGLAAYRSAGPAPAQPHPEAPLPTTAAPPPKEADHAARTDRFGDLLPPGAVARLGTTRLRQSEPVTALAFSPDRKILASGGRDEGIVHLWDAASGKELRRFRGHQRPPDAPNARTISSLTFLADGQTVASIGGDGGIRLWDARTGKETGRLGEQVPAQCLELSPDGKWLAAGCWDNRVRLWEVAAGKETGQLVGHQGPVIAVAFAAGGKTLASGGDDGIIRLWDVAGLKEVGQLKGHQRRVLRLAFGPDAKTLVSSGQDNTLRVWDVAAAKELHRLDGAHVSLGSFALAPDGKLLVAASRKDGRPWLWDVATGKEVRQLASPGPLPTAFAFSPDGKTVAAGGQANTIHLWDVSSGKEIGPGEGHQSAVRDVAFCGGGKMLVSGGDWDPLLRLWDPATAKQLREIPARRGWGGALAVSPDGNTLAAGGAKIALWDVASGDKVREWPGHPTGTYHVAWSPDGMLLASTSWNNDPVRLWDVATGKELRQLAQPGNASSVAFSPDGRVLAAGNMAGSVQLWDPSTGKQLGQLLQATEEVWSLTFSSDGRTLAVGSHVSAGRGEPKPSKLRLWELATGQERHLFPGKDIGVRSVAFCPDGRTLVSAGGTGVWLWDVAAGKQLGRLEGHDGGVTAVAVAPQGDRVASAGLDTTVLIWGVADLIHKRQREPVRFSADEADALWSNLAGGDAAKAGLAVWRLAAAPEQTLAYFQRHLQPIQPADPKRLASLLDDLESNRFEVREQASRELEQLGDAAEPALRRALEGRPSAEARRRMKRALEKLALPSGERLRAVRAVEVLEHLATVQARQLLDKLAGGVPTALLTQEAKAARDRLAKDAAIRP
jgi:RNA polymerase sigma factor (sigma-70 family)